MEVQIVDLIEREDVDLVLQFVDGKEVAAHIDECATVCEARAVVDGASGRLPGYAADGRGALHLRREELEEGLRGVPEAVRRRGFGPDHLRGNGKGVGFVALDLLVDNEGDGALAALAGVGEARQGLAYLLCYLLVRYVGLERSELALLAAVLMIGVAGVLLIVIAAAIVVAAIVDLLAYGVDIHALLTDAVALAMFSAGGSVLIVVLSACPLATLLLLGLLAGTGRGVDGREINGAEHLGLGYLDVGVQAEYAVLLLCAEAFLFLLDLLFLTPSGLFLLREGSGLCGSGRSCGLGSGGLRRCALLCGSLSGSRCSGFCLRFGLRRCLGFDGGLSLWFCLRLRFRLSLRFALYLRRCGSGGLSLCGGLLCGLGRSFGLRSGSSGRAHGALRRSGRSGSGCGSCGRRFHFLARRCRRSIEVYAPYRLEAWTQVGGNLGLDDLLLTGSGRRFLLLLLAVLLLHQQFVGFLAQGLIGTEFRPEGFVLLFGDLFVGVGLDLHTRLF